MRSSSWLGILIKYLERHRNTGLSGETVTREGVDTRRSIALLSGKVSRQRV
jgi:hypothetical protein